MDLDLFCWNCRGICGDDTTRSLKDLLAQNRQMVFLCEMKISAEQDFFRLQHVTGFPRSKMVLSNGRSGGLGLFWSELVQVQTLSKLAHQIDVEIVNNPGLASWHLTSFYGYVATGDRDRTWQLLRELVNASSLSWLVIGDFNEILNGIEKIDSASKPERQMREFRDALGYGELLDLGYHGVMKTWGNSKTLLDLDRAVFTISWFDIFFHTTLFHLPPSDSDHVLLLLKASTTPIQAHLKVHRFQFEAYWLEHTECHKVVKETWQEEIHGIPMYHVVIKIQKVRIRLDKWQGEIFRGRQVKMMAIRNRLEELIGCSITPERQAEKVELFGNLNN